MSLEYQHGKFSISTDQDKMDIDFVHDFLCHHSYWAQGRPREVVQKSIENSLCFGLFQGAKQIGFARVVTDLATFAWLCDVFVEPSYRQQGLGKWLLEKVVAHPDLQQVKYILLATRDAHEFYRKYGNFETPRALDKWMVRYKDEK